MHENTYTYNYTCCCNIFLVKFAFTAIVLNTQQKYKIK